MFGFKKKKQLKEQVREITKQKVNETLFPVPTKKRFTGKTEGFADNRERHFYQRMLRAYLRGQTHFNFGFSDQTNSLGFVERRPDTYRVMFEFY